MSMAVIEMMTWFLLSWCDRALLLIALQIDLVLSEQEIVIKQFEGPAPKPIGVAGATVLGDGRIMPIADVLEILDIFQGRISTQTGSSWQQKATPTDTTCCED